MGWADPDYVKGGLWQGVTPPLKIRHHRGGALVVERLHLGERVDRL
jgi:hypothetical protein